MHNSQSNRIATLLVEKHKILALLSLMLLLFFAYGVSDLKQQAGYRVFFHDGNKDLHKQLEKEKNYSPEDDIVFIVESKSGNIFTKENLDSIEKLTEDSWHIPYFTRVNSLTNFQQSKAEDDTLKIEYFYSSDSNHNKESIAELKKDALSHPEIKNLFVSDKANGSAVQVRLTLSDDIDKRVKQRNESVEFARDIRKKVEALNSDLIIHMVGRSMLNKSFEEMVLSDSETLVPVMFLIIIILMIFLTRSVMATISSLVLIISVVIMTLGFMGWLGYSINQTNSQITIILLSISICNCVHILSNYRQNIGVTKDRKLALISSYETNLKSIFLTNLTTILGFLSMNLSDSPVYQELGTSVSFGILATYILTMGLFPALLILTRINIKPVENGKGKSENFVKFLMGKRKLIFSFGAVLTITLSAMTSLNVVNDDLITYFSEGHEFRVGAEFVQENITGFDELNYELNTGVENGVKSPEFLQKLDRFCNWLESQPKVVHVRCFSKIMKRLNQNMNEDDPAFYKIPNDQELASQYLLLYELSLPYGMDLTNMINFDKSATLVSAHLSYAKTNDFIELEKAVANYFEEVEPEYSTEAVSLSNMFAHIGLDTIKNMVAGSIVAIFLIAITLGLAFKSFKFGLISILPNAFPALIVFGIWGIFVGEVNLPISVIFSVTIGIIVDDTVHFMTKYLNARKDGSKTVEEALSETFFNVGRALMVTTTILVMGFFTLALSTFEVNAVLGLMAGGTILTALLLDFFMLPLLIKMFDKEKATNTLNN